MNIELACRDLVFHFNKAYLKDPTIPMWVVKTKGKTYYVNHVDAEIPWSTKETPDNEHTKGSIKFKNCLCQIDADNCVKLLPLTEEDKIRLGEVERIPSIIWMEGDKPNLEEVLQHHNIPNQGALTYSGACTTTKQMAGILDDRHLSLLKLRIPGLRVLNENEVYYRIYNRWLDNGNGRGTNTWYEEDDVLEDWYD